MSISPKSHPTILPDYYSEENWNYFLSLLPESETRLAPRYEGAAKSLDDTEAEMNRQGYRTLRVKVDAREWEGWVRAKGKPVSRETVGEFAMQKWVDEGNDRNRIARSN